MQLLNEDIGVKVHPTGRIRRHNHHWNIAVSRFAAVLLPAVAALSLVAPDANAVPDKKLDDNLAALWTTVLQTPSAQNPFFSDDGGCYDLGRGTVAPFGAHGAKSCTVKPGTKIFVAASTVECSTFEGNGTTDAVLRDCASQGDVQVAPSVTVDGQSLSVNEVETPLLNIILPEDNILGAQAGPGLSVAHGWAALLHPLTPGEHEIVIDTSTPDHIITTITVDPAISS
jgi:hypothetical protein